MCGVQTNNREMRKVKMTVETESVEMKEGGVATDWTTVRTVKVNWYGVS